MNTSLNRQMAAKANTVRHSEFQIVTAAAAYLYQWRPP